MARRRKISPLEDIVEVVSKLPWWVGTVLAVVSFLVLYSLASRPPAVSLASGQIGETVGRMYITALATFGQYLLPFVFCVPSLLSAVEKLRQKKAYARGEDREDAASLDESGWEDFEGLVAEYYRRAGFQVTWEGGNSPDGGIDLVLRKGKETHIVQGKQWKNYKVAGQQQNVWPAEQLSA
jgi:restriction system protein